MAIFWVVAPCSLVEVYQLMMEAARTSETLVNFYQTIRRYNPEDSHLRTIVRTSDPTFILTRSIIFIYGVYLTTLSVAFICRVQ
jgi:hypothetical protein